MPRIRLDTLPTAPTNTRQKPQVHLKPSPGASATEGRRVLIRPGYSERTAKPHRVRRHLAGLVKAANRPLDVAAFEEALVRFCVDAADMLGVPKSIAAIYGICLASPEPVSFSDIGARLDISAGSISQGLRVLREVGALKVAPGALKSTERTKAEMLKSGRAGPVPAPARSCAPPSQKTARYEPDLELRKLVLDWVEKRLQVQLSSGSDVLIAIIAAIPQAPAGSSAMLQQRLGALKSWHDKTKSLLPIVKSFLMLG